MYITQLLGIDADLLKCENNYHWNKKPPYPPSPTSDKPNPKDASVNNSTETLRAG